MNTGTPTPDSASHFSWRRCRSPARRARSGTETAAATSKARSAMSPSSDSGSSQRGAGPNAWCRCCKGCWYGALSTAPNAWWTAAAATIAGGANRQRRARQVAVRKDEQQQRDRGDQPDRALGEQRDEPIERSRCTWVAAEHLPEPFAGCGVAECHTDEGEQGADNLGLSCAFRYQQTEPGRERRRQTSDDRPTQ